MNWWRYWENVSSTAVQYVEKMSETLEGMTDRQLRAYVDFNKGGNVHRPEETDDSYVIRNELVSRAKGILEHREAEGKVTARLDAVVKTQCASSSNTPACRYAQTARDHLVRFVKTMDLDSYSAGMQALSHLDEPTLRDLVRDWVTK